MPRISYQKKLLDPRWQKIRLDVLNRDCFTCQSCGNNKKTLHVHHECYHKNPWDTPIEKLTTYCEICHELIEKFKENLSEKNIFIPIKIIRRLSKGVKHVEFFSLICESKDGLVVLFFNRIKDSKEFILMATVKSQTIKDLNTILTVIEDGKRQLLF